MPKVSMLIPIIVALANLKLSATKGSLPAFSISRFQRSIDIEIDGPSSPNTTEWYGAVRLSPFIRSQRLVLGKYDTLYVAESWLNTWCWKVEWSQHVWQCFGGAMCLPGVVPHSACSNLTSGTYVGWMTLFHTSKCVVCSQSISRPSFWRFSNRFSSTSMAE